MHEIAFQRQRVDLRSRGDGDRRGRSGGMQHRLSPGQSRRTRQSSGQVNMLTPWSMRMTSRFRPKVLLLEKSELTAGSTWHAAGLTTTFHPLVNLKKLHWYSMNFFKEIEKESGQQIGFHQPGSLRLATTPTRYIFGEDGAMINAFPTRMDEFYYQLSRQGWNEAPMKIWSQKEIERRIPIIDMEGANVNEKLYLKLCLNFPLSGSGRPFHTRRRPRGSVLADHGHCQRCQKARRHSVSRCAGDSHAADG